MNKFWQFLQDENNKFSSMRLGFLIVIVPVMYVWTFLSLEQSQILDIPIGVYSLIGILATGKLGQVWVHKKYNKKILIQKTKTSSNWLITIWNYIKKFIPFIKK